MTTSKTTPLELTGQSLTEAKAKVWHLGLRLWMWKHQPHLRERPSYPEHEHNEVEFVGITDAIHFNKVWVCPLWTIDLDKIAYYSIFTNEGYWLGNVKHLDYILNASKTKI